MVGIVVSCPFRTVRAGSSAPQAITVRPTKHGGGLLRYGRRETSSERRGVKRLARVLPVDTLWSRTYRSPPDGKACRAMGVRRDLLVAERM